MDENDQKAVTGDWVKGKTLIGELVHGYIESYEQYSSIVKIMVTSSDNEELIGKVIRVDEKNIRKVPRKQKWSEGELLNLIDLALSTREEKWFITLSNELNRLNQSKKTLGSGSVSSIIN
ncbi:IDEAL domain-containing protein [Bacillus suaedae]|uniref:IDEAL domain-containing protein n=1 Tax=Halalkalibacter suaedae TaxID=2822140 RepID=A0A941ANM2_9BACI|nr:IDEAL domain-containing protein [Bacillus suaedae]MBP3950966.1 IDEAL domain-containing protein [Bacillus suaedae]